MKRALLGADPHETTIHLRLAKLYNDLEDYREAAGYHQRIIDTLIADRAWRPSSNILFIFLMSWTFRYSRNNYPISLLGTPDDIALSTVDKPVADYAKSSILVAQYHLQQGGGDLYHAKTLMEAVASSQSEEVPKAVELLKRIKVEIAARPREPDVGSKSHSTVGEEGVSGMGK